MTRTLEFYKIESDFFRNQTTKKQRAGVRKSHVDMNRQKELRNVMFDEIFPFYKFVNKEKIKDLENGSIAVRVMTKMGIEKKDMAEFWAWNHEVAEKTFTEYRSLAMQAMK